jgi:hypothetical protein
MSASHNEHATTIEESIATFSAAERVELADRQLDGVAVALYWARGTDLLTVRSTMQRPVTRSSSSSPRTSGLSTCSGTRSHMRAHAESSCSATGVVLESRSTLSSP